MSAYIPKDSKEKIEQIRNFFENAFTNFGGEKPTESYIYPARVKEAIQAFKRSVETEMEPMVLDYSLFKENYNHVISVLDAKTQMEFKKLMSRISDCEEFFSSIESIPELTQTIEADLKKLEEETHKFSSKDPRELKNLEEKADATQRNIDALWTIFTKLGGEKDNPGKKLEQLQEDLSRWEKNLRIQKSKIYAKKMPSAETQKPTVKRNLPGPIDESPPPKAKKPPFG